MSCPCPDASDGPNPIILPTPPSSCSQADTRFRDITPPYSGPLRYGSMMVIPLDKLKVTPKEAQQALSTVEIPDSWSWGQDSTNGNNMIEDGSRNQKNCGSCWAFGVASALGDRYAIKYKIAAPYPSVTNLVSCAGPVDGTGIAANIQCRCGGDPLHACKWLESNSIKNSKCWPYTMITNHKENKEGPCKNMNIAPNCPKWDKNCCADCCNSDQAKYEFSIEPGSTEPIQVFDGLNFDVNLTIRAIKQELMGVGPVVTTISVPTNFMNFWNRHKNSNNNSGLLTEEVFIPGEPTNPIEGHAMVITGWGRKDGRDFWEVRNSWGKPGYFYFAMTTSTPKGNECGIDVPLILGGTSIGGGIKFRVGPLLPKNIDEWPKGIGSVTPKGSGWDGSQHRTTWLLLILMIGVLLAVILIALII